MRYMMYNGLVLANYTVELNILFGIFILTCFASTLGIGSSFRIWVTELPILPFSIFIVLSTLWLWSDNLDGVIPNINTRMYGPLSIGLVLVPVSMLFIGLYLSHPRPGEQYFEYSVLVLLGTFALDILLRTNNFAMFFLALELNSLCVYVLAGYEIRSLRSRDSGIKYFVSGSFSSLTFLFGIAILYFHTGFILFTDFSVLLSIQGIPSFVYSGATIGALVCTTGLVFKVYAAPFHFRVIDVYHGAPWCSLLYIGSVSPMALLYVLGRVQTEAFSFCSASIIFLLEFLCCVTLIIGASGGILQRNIRKILGYSSISTTGFFLAGLCVRDLSVQIISYEYTFIYATTVIAVVLIFHNCSIEFNSPDTIDWLMGLCAKNRKISCYVVFFFSLIGGLPPFSLFMLKYAMSAVFYTTFLQIVLFIALGASIINLYVYYRLLQNVYYGGDRVNILDVRSPTLPYGLEVFLFLLAVLQLIISFYGGAIDIYFYLLLVH